MPLAVRFNPADPSRSFVLEPDVEVLLQQRDFASPPDPNLPDRRSYPWLKPLLWPLFLASCLGLVVSPWVHIEALMGRPLDAFFWFLHVGIFLVWLPAMFVAQSLARAASRKDVWKVMLKDLPVWMRYFVYGSMLYAMVNFLLCWITVVLLNGNPQVLAGRAFSGHWMAFYSGAMAILYAGARRNFAA